MKKNLLLLVSFFVVTLSYSQKDRFWSSVSSTSGLETAKAVERISFPQEFKLFQLNLDAFRQELSTAPDRFSQAKSSTIVSIPNVDGGLERFEMYEASNFEPDLQAQFPDIRAYVGIGLDDKYAQIRLSVAPNGIQSMIFRTDKKNEFMEPYSSNGLVYAVFKSSRNKGSLPFTCSTDDVQLVNELSSPMMSNRSNVATYKTMRLVLSCTGEYANYFGATSAAQVANVITAFNNTMTRVNGVFEKDFAVHLNIISANNVIYYAPTSDPYSDAAVGTATANANNANGWNIQLQNTLTNNVGNAAYDIGHLFGGSGGGGNAGCIGCVCVDDSAGTLDKNKGSGFTSPIDGIPAGDNYDIDYVAHEMGHQLGCNHTFSHSGEDNSVNVEPGSGSTIMGYAGITGTTDVQSHSDDYFVYRSILQVQTNLASKSCPISTPITHGVPVVDAGQNYIIPKSTPFKLTGTGSDPSGSAVTFCWEENDDATGASASGAGSFPSPTKTNGPNFRSFDPVSVPYRYMPALSTVLNNSLSTTWEATSSVARILNFVLTCRDNVVGGGLTQSDAMVVNVNGTVGPFDITSQNTTGISWTQGSSQLITWTTNGAETLSGSANVDILLSTDGGATFTTTLASNTPNDQSETIVVPNIAAPNCRIMVKPTGNIYYDINTTPFAIGYTVTTVCNTYSNSTPLTIPDGLAQEVPGSTATNTISVPLTGTVSDVNVSLNVTHSWPNDLIINIGNPGGVTQVPVWNRSCAGNDNFNVTLNDGSPAYSCVANMTGTFSPASPLSAFNGSNSNGTWSLSVADYFNQDTGTVNSWSVIVCSQVATLITEDFGLDNFSIYPNPNSGVFGIKFDSKSTNEIAVEVHDIRGRQVYGNTYQNTGVFEQTIELNSVQAGVYMVTVKDGNRKEVKKIVIE